MIDVKRLAVDAGYWDECGAPEGATHYSDKSGKFLRDSGKTTGRRWHAYHDGRWIHAVEVIPAYLTPRPQPQPEWVDGLPQAGTVCECHHTDLSGKKQWVGCDVVGPYGDYVICAPNGGGFYGFDADELRPIPTKAQRDRDKLAVLIAAANAMCDLKKKEYPAGFIAECIMNEYNLEPKK